MTRAPVPRGTGTGLRKKHLLWAIPLGVVAISGLLVLALPKFVSSGYHRATIEGLASALTGRQVHINGRLSLALLPHPQFIAGDVTITSPDKETVTAASLTLDIAPFPLLRGQILARSITLQSPHIALPWPLPGGAAAIAPPRWLTALHAQINNGEVSLGGATFTHVSADIYTGSDGAFALSGTGEMAGTPLNLSLGFGALSAVGSTPVTLDVQTDTKTKLQAHLSGIYDSSSTVSGQATFSAASLAALDSGLAQPVTGSAEITADPNQIALTNLNVAQAGARLSGSASLALAQPLLTLLLTGQNLVLPLNENLLDAAGSAFGALPVHLALDADNTRISSGGSAFSLPHLHSSIYFGTAGASIAAFDAGLPGNSSLSLSGTLSSAGALQAKAIFSSLNIVAFFSAYGAAPVLPATWQEASLAASVSGTANRLAFDNLTGNFGPARVTGTAILDQRRSLMGALHFDQLDLTPFAAMLRNPPDGFGGDNPLTADFEISADRASIDKIPLEHLLLDAKLSDQLVVRRLTANLFGGIAAASFTLSPNPNPPAQQTTPRTGLISSARAILALPSAEPVAALLPPWLQPPAALDRAPLAFSFLAAGPATALATSASLTLGAVSITAAPSIDLIHQTATGAFTLRHPDAIAAFKAFGLNAGLAWPGAGSIALRADMLLTPTEMGFSDFVLSMGDLTGNGRLIYRTDHQLNGEIDADTLALPPIPADLTPLWADLADMQGKIALSANRVLVAGNQVLGPATGNITLSPNRLDLAITQANLANGVLKGEFTATAGTAPANPAAPGTGSALHAALPVIAAKLAVSGADSSLLNFPLVFPVTLSAGSIDAAIDVTANGYAPQAWLATLTGSASLAAQSGTLNGFNLPAVSSALHAKNGRYNLLRSACLTGTTPFTQISIRGSFGSGIYTLTRATLQSPEGSATATGSVDLPDAGLTLTASLLPNVPAPPTLGLTITGSWTAPRKITALKPALAWKPPATK